MPKAFNTTEDFLGHSSRSKGTKFVSWKDDGSLVFWLHTKQMPFATWVHSFPKVFIKKEDGTETRSVFFGKFNCHEDESILKQNFRNPDGSRKAPFKKCGMCKFVEWVRGQVVSGALPWTKPIFRFDHEDPTKTIVIHAAGIYNGFKGDLTKEQKEELSKAGISLKKVWGENGQAKCEYVFTIVDNAHPDAGVQVTNETAMLGDKLKDRIAEQRESKGADAGDPFKNPYAFKFIYNKDEDLQKKYAVRILEGVPITPLIKQLITETDPPEVERMIAPFNVKEMRTHLETHCLIKNVPWDTLFEVGDDEEHDHEGEDEKSDADESHATEPEDDGLVECDKCGKPMKATDTKCGNCGAEYEVEPENKPEPEPEPAKKPPKRSEMKGGKKMPF